MNDQEQDLERKREIIDAMIEDFKNFKDLKNEINEKIINLQIQNIYNRQDYYKHITSLTVALLGFSAVMIGQKENIFFPYLVISIITFIILVILLLSHLRESLDKDAKDFKNQQLEYEELFEEREKIFNLNINKEDLDLKKYLNEIKNSTIIKNFVKKIKKLKTEKKDNGLKLNYFGELIIFLFVAGVYFVILSLLNIKLSSYLLVMSLLILVGISFNDISRIVSNFLNNFIAKIFKK